MRRSVELQIITETLSKMGPHVPATRIWGRAPGATAEQGADGNVWAGDVHDVAFQIVTRLYGRPSASPLAQAEEAHARRDIGALVGTLVDADHHLTHAPWYPVRPGDLVHVHYEATPTLSAYGETYLVAQAGASDDLMGMRLLAHTFEGADPDEYGVGAAAVDAADDPVYGLWFEAGPQRLTIVRDGRPVHIGGAR